MFCFQPRQLLESQLFESVGQGPRVIAKPRCLQTLTGGTGKRGVRGKSRDQLSILPAGSSAFHVKRHLQVADAEHRQPYVARRPKGPGAVWRPLMARRRRSIRYAASANEGWRPRCEPNAKRTFLCRLVDDPAELTDDGYRGTASRAQAELRPRCGRAIIRRAAARQRDSPDGANLRAAPQTCALAVCSAAAATDVSLAQEGLRACVDRWSAASEALRASSSFRAQPRCLVRGGTVLFVVSRETKCRACSGAASPSALQTTTVSPEPASPRRLGGAHATRFRHAPCRGKSSEQLQGLSWARMLRTFPRFT